MRSEIQGCFLFSPLHHLMHPFLSSLRKCLTVSPYEVSITIHNAVLCHQPSQEAEVSCMTRARTSMYTNVRIVMTRRLLRPEIGEDLESSENQRARIEERELVPNHEVN